MPQIGFFFDQTRCTGCHTCSVSCKDWHDVPAGPARLMRILKTEEGRFPDLFVSYTIAPCYHCADPVCLAICPNDAISKREKDGIVVVEREKCRGQQPCGLIPDAANGLSFGDQQSPCQVSCPVHLGIPAYVALIASGRFNQALELV